jgi:hypothetical protein
MQRATRSRVAVSAVLAALSAQVFLPSAARAQETCAGHRFLDKPRSPASCLAAAPEVYASPDKALTAVVLPVDVSLYATPDMESRVVIYEATGKTISSKDFSSPRGENGYYVYRAEWSPDSQFFVLSLTSSGGHSPWSYPIWVFSRQQRRFVDFSAMIGGKPTLVGDFSFSAPHTVHATTWKGPGDNIVPVPVTVDLAQALAKLPPGPADSP